MKREKGLDFARALAAIGIVLFHFYSHSSSAHKLFLNNANGSWGAAINYLFFALSGFLLHKKYGQQKKLRIIPFYYKRWKATMPAYIAVFLFAFFLNVASAGKLFYLDIPKWRLVLSFIGMDGYIAWTAPTYFITGEWFLGAILIAYAAYPFLRWVANSTLWIRYLGLGILIALYGVIWRVNLINLPPATNPITCLLCFYLGMLGAEHTDFLKKRITVLSAFVLCGILFLIPLGGRSTTKMLIAGCASLVFLNSLGNVLCKNKIIDRLICGISGLTYPIFLIHHRIIVTILEGFDTVSTLCSLGVLLAVLLSSLLFAKILGVLMKSFFKSNIYQKFESLFQAKRNETL